MRSTLTLPAPGTIEVSKGFMDPEVVAAANTYTREGTQQIAGYLITNTPPDLVNVLAMQHPSIAKMADLVINGLPFEWSRLSVYVRHMERPRLGSLSIHDDVTRDMRVLIEGDGSTWLFDQPKPQEDYPNGLPLSIGDAVTLNNQCQERSQQLRHGVNIAPDRMIRTSYLFNFI